MKFFPRLALLIALLAAPLTRAQTKEVIIQPRAHDTSALPATGRADSAVSNTPLLFFALAAAGVGGWLLWRQRRSPSGIAARDARKLAIAETRSLGNRQYLVVADYDGRKFLLGVCPGRIDLLSALDGSGPTKTP